MTAEACQKCIVYQCADNTYGRVQSYRFNKLEAPPNKITEKQLADPIRLCAYRALVAKIEAQYQATLMEAQRSV